MFADFLVRSRHSLRNASRHRGWPPGWPGRRADSGSDLLWFCAVVVLSLGVGWLVTTGLIGAALAVLALAVITGLVPAVVPAILLVGVGFLHALTYLSVGFATRADVLGSPQRFLPILGALFVPPVIAVVVRKQRLLPQGMLSWTDPRGRLLLGMSALLALLFIRVINSPSPVYGLTKCLGFAAYSVFPVALIMVTIRSREDVQRVVGALFVLGFIWVALVLSGALARGSLNLYQGNPGIIFGGANQAAGGIGSRAAIVAIVGLGMVICGRKGRGRYLLGAGLAVGILVLSGHRGSLIAFVLGMLALWFLGRSFRRLPGQWARQALAILVLVVASAWAWQSAPAFIRTRYDNPFEALSFQSRLRVQRLALEGWLEAPLFGKGTGSSAFLIARADEPKFGVVQGIYPHNLTVELLAEVGLLGTLVYLGTLLGVAGASYRVLRARGDSEWVLPILAALTVQAFVFSQGGGDLTTNNQLWITAALLAVATSDIGR